jgi:predicted NUDIX family NTP pyrophosphohydrolase
MSLKSLATEMKSEMADPSAGILMYRRSGEEMLVLLVHPGGPFWKKKDLGAWSIPKGEHGPDEDAGTAARREFFEELGEAPSGALRPLGRARQRGGKWVEAFALEGDFDVEKLKSDSFVLEWPPKSGNIQQFPEIDRAEWFSLPSARVKILASQLPFLDRLEELLSKASH